MKFYPAEWGIMSQLIHIQLSTNELNHTNYHIQTRLTLLTDSHTQQETRGTGNFVTLFVCLFVYSFRACMRAGRNYCFLRHIISQFLSYTSYDHTHGGLYLSSHLVRNHRHHSLHNIISPFIFHTPSAHRYGWQGCIRLCKTSLPILLKRRNSFQYSSPYIKSWLSRFHTTGSSIHGRRCCIDIRKALIASDPLISTASLLTFLLTLY